MENDFPISQIVQRYDLAADKDLLYSYEELRRLNLDQRFIYTLLQTFEDEKTFSEKEYEIFSLETIIDYLRRTHSYYLSKKLLEIEQSIDILSKDYSGNHPLLHILNTFFKFNERFKKVQFVNCSVDKITYAFLKSNQANLTGITVLD